MKYKEKKKKLPIENTIKISFTKEWEEQHKEISKEKDLFNYLMFDLKTKQILLDAFVDKKHIEYLKNINYYLFNINQIIDTHWINI
mgnify:CR=1 FL=1